MIDYFSSMCELITMVGVDFLDRCIKYCGVGWWMKTKYILLKHKYLKYYVKKISIAI